MLNNSLLLRHKRIFVLHCYSVLLRGCLYGSRDGTFAEKPRISSRVEFPFIREAGRDVIRDVNKAGTTLKSCKIFVFLHQNDVNKLFNALIQQYF